MTEEELNKGASQGSVPAAVYAPLPGRPDRQHSAGLSDLLARVEAATGADREIDARLWCWRQGYEFDRMTYPPEGTAYVCRFNYEGCNYVELSSMVPDFTASLDAALALVERTTEGALLDIEGSWEPRDKAVWPAWSVRWYPAGTMRDGKSWHARVGTARTPALALLAALLKALIAQQEAR